MFEDCTIRVRIDEEGYTHVTFTEYTEDGVEISYTEHEEYQAKGVYQDGGREFLANDLGSNSSMDNQTNT